MTMTFDKPETSGWYSEESSTFGDRVAGAREAMGLDQEELARRLGVKLKTVQAWETDMSEPRANKLQMMAGLLNVSIMWLLTGNGDGLSDPSDSVPLTAEARDTLTEFRQIRTEILALGNRLGVLEKRLRKSLQEG